MSHTHLLIPHPVLRPHGFDYDEMSHFDIVIKKAEISNKKILLDLCYDLSSDTLNKMMDLKQAKFCLVIKCSKTHMRITYNNMTQNISQVLSLSDYAGRLTITPYVVANKNIKLFISKEHSDEFRQMAIDTQSPDYMQLPEGSILAIGETHEIIIDSIQKITSAIKLVSNNKLEKGTYDIRTDQDYIHIELHPETKKSIIQMRKSAGSLLYSSIYLSTFEHAIRDLVDNDVKHHKWVPALKNTLKSYGVEMDDERLYESAHLYAQKIMQKPLEHMIKWIEHERYD